MRIEERRPPVRPRLSGKEQEEKFYCENPA
jgi:hypothetical protein